MHTNRLLSKLRRTIPRILRGSQATALTPTQEMFVLWNSARLGIPVDQSRTRYARSWSAIPNGHRGSEYREYNDLSYDIFQVLYGDDQASVLRSYEFFAPMHFLRMLSYPDPVFGAEDEIVRLLSDRARVTILDFGCGLAHQSRALARHLRASNKDVNLVLADIPTVRKDFLLWLGEQSSTSTTFLDCTEDQPIPDLPPCEICFATEFFEHVYDPVTYLDRFHEALNAGGLLVTEVSDHQPEFMHVSPKLEAVRERIKQLGI